LTLHFSPVTTQQSAIGANTKISSSAIIYPNVSIGNNVQIGERTTIYPGAVIYENCVIGNDVIIHANVVVGGHAFYYKKRPEGYDKMHSCGRTVIHDRVEIGAGTSIDKGVTGDTVIGAGTKIDNHVHIGHDVVVGKDCLFAAQVGIAGCVVIEDNVTLWGQVGVISGITIGKGAVVQGQSGVGKSLAGGKTYFGSPCEEGRAKLKELGALRQLPDLLEKLNKKS
jgi:UDP-3-O-[3-hydroxymyristoyl] glucosamine N-acyltransferase